MDYFNKKDLFSMMILLILTNLNLLRDYAENQTIKDLSSFLI